MKIIFAVCALLLTTAPVFAGENRSQPPALLLSNIYRDDINLRDYWVSEKFDGVRAYWNGKHLLSRQGNIYHAPDWFTSALPDTKLDGELWIGRGKFELLSGIVRRQSASPSDWSNIKYMVFDLPVSQEIFDERLKLLRTIITKINNPHIQMVEQHKVSSHEALMRKLDTIVGQGAEGLMLHRGSSVYKNTRSDDLLKLKKYLDAEAIVIAHVPGKGKLKGLLGSLEVETSNNIRFKIGTGFSDAERRNPPAIGSVITYRYFGLTNKGTPRFASFVRVKYRY